ncbi:MAG: flagellar assembly protein FliH [Pirellulales bacterium]|nr:flagellar assembly protein FliH [Pirellulales bacterium]
MANVLKSETVATKTDAARKISGLAGFNLSDLADEGLHQLEECRAQIRRLLAEAEVDAAQIRAKAETEGYQEGLQRAAVDADRKLKEEAERRAKDGLQLLRQSISQLHQEHQQWLRQYSDSLSTIALAAAERVLRRKLQDEPELLVQWAEDALRSTRTASSLTLAVHPETLAQLGQPLDELLNSPDLPEQTAVQPDESIPPGEISVRQTGGEIRAGLLAQLKRLEELLV